MGRTREVKEAYFAKLRTLMETYKSVFVANVDNVGSNQMHQVRQALRGRGVILMGKNTMVRRAIKSTIAEFPQYEKFLPHVRGNVGFVFTNEDLKEIRDLIVSNKVRAPARAGAFAPLDVFVEPTNTGMEPGKTSFFQALNIPTKIARGTIEITSRVHIVVAGTRVGASEATLLNMLNISPFTYGMTIVQVYDQGNVFPPSVLDISQDQLLATFMSGIKTVASLSLAANFPTMASVPHSLVNSYKNLLAIAIGTEYNFSNTAELKERLANPEAFAAAAPAAGAAAAADAPAAAAEEKKEEEAEESDDDMGFGLFD